MSDRVVDPRVHHHRHTLPFGAQSIGGGKTRFRFWAPSRDHVELEIEGGETHAMTRSSEGWFDVEAHCGPGALYRYRLDANLAVPDPASRWQPQDVHGPSAVFDPCAYRWIHSHWHGRRWEETVLYELHVGAMGGYNGVKARLPELAALGITAIELMPLNDFPGRRNWGYDGVLPFAPDSAYGTPDELKALIDTAHGHGLQVFLDVVYNHFGPDGNYLRSYAEPFFKEGRHTPWGPAIDFDRPEVGQYFIENALYWVHEYRVDGLRFDAVHAIHNPAWLREVAEHIRRSIERDRHVHLMLENEENTASLLTCTSAEACNFNAQWNDDFHNTLHVMLTGETESYYSAFAEAPATKLARALAEGFVYQGEPSPIHDGKPRGEPSAGLPPSAFISFLQNHDQVGNRAMGERLTLLAEPGALRAAVALLLLSPQIPMLFMDEENGSTRPFLFFTDYMGDLADAVREGRRREFAKFAVFSNPERREHIPDPNDPRTFERSGVPMPDTDASAGPAVTSVASEDSTDSPTRHAREWRHFYQSALAVRTRLLVPRLKRSKSLGAQVLQEPAALDGESAALLAARRMPGSSPGVFESRSPGVSTSPDTIGVSSGHGKGGGVCAQWQLGDGEVLTIAINLGDHAVSLGKMPAGKIIFETPDRVRDHLGTDRLPPHAAVAWLTGDLLDFLHSHPETRA
ncbi:malto-oligosyltrehalose trehalohydrolase [Pararobbsia alpina]|uniref:Malto-oligosyltrehalose trehalohydrolase n=1 Tax=Pararobbsia alpina TaxID=621374 RepID=A0A6S7BC26_9BURK|nr:malto-oligosyltrehalose trehalohydrolase [Pararobbsia alpina]CAB3786018.1 1,4-alpha-glucan branching enzyme GlgB [Pararobbsia alpina]